MLRVNTGLQLTHQLAQLMTSAAPLAVFDISRQLKTDIKPAVTADFLVQCVRMCEGCSGRLMKKPNVINAA